MINCVMTDSLTDIGDSRVAFATENNFNAKSILGPTIYKRKDAHLANYK